MPKPKFVIVVRRSWQQEPLRSVDGVMFAQQVGSEFKWDILGFLGKACGIRDDQLERGRSVETLSRLFPRTREMWPDKLTNNIEGLLGTVNDYDARGPEKEAKLQDMFKQLLDIDLHFVDTWEQEAALRTTLGKVVIHLHILRPTWRRWPESIASPGDKSLLELVLALPIPQELRVKLEEPSSPTRRMLELLNDMRVVSGYGQEQLIEAFLNTLGIRVTFSSQP